MRRKIYNFPRWLLVHRQCLKTAYYIYKLAIAIKPDFAEGLLLFAETLILLGRYEEAFEIWEKIFQLRPDWEEGRGRIQSTFYFNGQAWAEKAILQMVIDARNKFAKEHQLDVLSIRLLSEFPTAIGHTALLDSYAKMTILGQRSPAKPILLVRASAANPAYIEYFRPYIPDVITDPVAFELLSKVGPYIEDHICAVKDVSGKQIYDPYSKEAAVQAQWDAECRGPLLTLKDEDQKRGQECLESLGIPKGAWFVTLHVRGGREKDRSARDADLATYRLAMEDIVTRGGWVIRMGDTSMIPLPPMPHVIDYAHSPLRRDWMDVFLWARCRFFIGCLSGPLMVPHTFGVPSVIANWSSLATRLWFKEDLYIFKLHWSEAESRYLNIAEVCSSALASVESNQYLHAKRIKLVDNTPEEIKDAVAEMLDRLDGKLKYTTEDDCLQEQFNRVCITNGNGANSRIGRDFLRKWSHLL